MTDLLDTKVYAMIGEDGFARLVAAFYSRVAADDILGPMYPADDMGGAEDRLREFLIGRFGGPPRYVEKRGHPRLRARHSPFRIDRAASDRWVLLMEQALAEARIPAEPAALLRSFFREGAAFMINAG